MIPYSLYIYSSMIHFPISLRIFLSLTLLFRCVFCTELSFKNAPAGSLPLGGTLLVTCQLPDQFRGIVKWYDRLNREIGPKDTSIGEDTRWETRDDYSSTLHIVPLQTEDQTTYICRATVGTTNLEKRLQVSLYEPFSFTRCVSPQHPTRGERNELITCEVTSQPPPDVSWKLNNIDIDYSNGRYQLSTGGLTLLNVDERHDGEYTIFASAGGRTEFRKIQVVTYTKPSIARLPDHFGGLKDKEVTLTCDTAGKPKPKVNWYKLERNDPQERGRLIRDEGEAGGVRVDAERGTLFYRRLNEEKTGFYRCEAFNGNSRDYRASQVTQLFVYVKPGWDLLMQNTSRPENGSAELMCRMRGNPEPELKWQKIGTPCCFRDGVQPDDSRITVTRGVDDQRPIKEYWTKLRITNLHRSDNATYRCRGRNQAGRHMYNGTIMVNYAPEFTENTPSYVYVWRGIKRNITCEIDGNPNGVWKWFRGNSLTPLENSERFHIYHPPPWNRTGFLEVNVIDNPSGDMSYRCEVVNEMGANETFIVARKANVPDSPIMNISMVDSTSVRIYITPSQTYRGPPLQHFDIGFVVIRKSSNFEISIRKPASVRFVTVDYLLPGTKYELRAAGVNEVGRSNYRKLEITTLPAAAPDAPKLRPTIPGPRDIVVTWDVNDNGAVIQHMHVRMRQVVMTGNSISKDVSDWSTWELLDPTLGMIRLDGLRPDTSYEVALRAENSQGLSHVGTRTYITDIDDGRFDQLISSASLASFSIHTVLLNILLLIS